MLTYADVCRRMQTYADVFAIRHYAASVTYQVTGMLAKNQDILGADVEARSKFSSTFSSKVSSNVAKNQDILSADSLKLLVYEASSY